MSGADSHVIFSLTVRSRSSLVGCPQPDVSHNASFRPAPGFEWSPVHLWMNESENACEKHHPRKAQQSQSESLELASRCLFGRWLAHWSFLIRCLAPPT